MFYLTTNNKVFEKILVLVLILMLFFPSSSNNNISSSYQLTQMFIVSLIMVFFLIKTNKVNLVQFSLAIFLLSLSIVFTVFSDLDGYAFGQLINFLPLLVLVISKVEYKGFLSNKQIVGLLYFVLSLILIIAWLPIFNSTAEEYLVKFYSASYDELVQRMVWAEKPVSIFASHSIAAFYYFIFIIFIVELISLRIGSFIFNCILLLAFLVSLLSLKSGTAAFLTLIGCIFFLFWLFNQDKKSYTIRYFQFFILVLLIVILPSLIDFVIANVDKLIGDESNGLASRYGEGQGALLFNLEQIYINPLIGIGFSHTDTLLFTDSDYILSLMKYGLLGFFIYYFLIFNFFTDFPLSKICKTLLIFSFFSFAVAYPIFTYLRTVSFLFFMYLLFSCLRENIERT